MVKLDRYIGTSVFFAILAVLGIIVGLALLFLLELTMYGALPI